MGIFGLIVFFVILIIVGIVGGLIYLLYLPIKSKLIKNGKLTKGRSRQINIAFVSILVLFSAYMTFDAFFPSKSFYEQEFKSVTLREIPKSAKFLEKNSSFPDFQGEYCSSSQIKLSKAEYKKLFSELSLDNRFTKNGQVIFSAELGKSLGEKSLKKIGYNFIRQIEGSDGHYLFIGFYDDMETVFVNICVT